MTTTARRRRHIPASTRARIRDGARSSAAVIADLIVDRFAPSAVVDVGAGEAFLADALRERGVQRVVSIDGDPHPNLDRLVDLTDPPDDLGQFDLAVCLEVAEHLPAEAAATLVEFLCDLASVVVFSAAIPRQGGPGHINEQWPGYWADLFAEREFVGSGDLRWEIWGDERIEPWYRQNLLVFAGELVPIHLRLDGCPSVVHPDIWTLYRP